jgi:hypothetical protein
LRQVLPLHPLAFAAIVPNDAAGRRTCSKRKERL